MDCRHGLEASASVLALTIALAVPSLAAAQTSTAPGALEEVVVTGSLLTRRDYTSTSPISTVGLETIQAVGAVTIDKVMSQQPQVVAPQTVFGGSAITNGSGRDRIGQSNVNLRGLGAERSLVLLDGRRLPFTNPYGAVDVNIIPLGLIESVETITGGASAVYGSDAMSGVINFKIKRRIQGVEATAQYNVTERGDGESYDLSISGGAHTDDGRANAIFSLSYSDRGVLRKRDRAFFDRASQSPALPYGTYVATATNLPSQAAIDAVFANYGVAAGRVSRSTSLGANRDGTIFATGQGIHNFKLPSGENGAGAYITTGPTAQYVASVDDWVQAPLKRYSAFSHFDYEFLPSVTLYGQALFTFYTYLGQSAGNAFQTTETYRVASVANPFIPADLRAILASRADPNANFLVGKRTLDLGPRQLKESNTVFQLMGGAKGDLPGDWAWDAYGSYARYENSENYIAGYSSVAAMNTLLQRADGGAALCAGGYNVFVNGPISESCKAYLTRKPRNLSTATQAIVEATTQGGLFVLPAGEVRGAAGVIYRRNTYLFSPDEGFLSGDVGPPVPAIDAKISNREIYGELLVPLLRGLPLIQQVNLGAGYRYSDYSTAGGANSYKVDLEWRIIEGLSVRAAYQRAIRAPNIAELYSGRLQGFINLGNVAQGAGDPCDITSKYRTGANASQVRALCLAQGLPSQIVDQYRYQTNLTTTYSGGNPELEPETADTVTTGVVWRPAFQAPLLRGISASLDAYKIKINGAIGPISATNIVPRCFNSAGDNPAFAQTHVYCNLISRDTTGFPSVRTPLLNLASYDVRGVDLSVNWAVSLEDLMGAKADIGRLSLDATVSYLNSFRIRPLPGAPVQEYVDTIAGGGLGQDITRPRWKSLTTLTYALGDIEVSARWRHIGGMKDISSAVNPATLVPGVPSYNYFDLNARWRVTEALELRVGATNIGDKMPPVAGGIPGNSDLGTYDVFGRSYYAALTARF